MKNTIQIKCENHVRACAINPHLLNYVTNWNSMVGGHATLIYTSDSTFRIEYPEHTILQNEVDDLIALGAIDPEHDDWTVFE